MKRVIVSLVFSTLLFSCDPNSDKQVGNRPLVLSSGSGNGNGNGSGNGTSATGGTADAPIDGGLSVLLLAGAAYGVKRFRNKNAKVSE